MPKALTQSLETSSLMSSTQALNASSYNEVELWHRRLGHLHVSKMRVLVPSLSESGVSELQSYVCKRAKHILNEDLSLELGNVNMPQDEESETNPETSNLDLTIAVRKGEKEPTRREALCAPHWKRAMMEEISALEKNETWEIVDLSPGKKTVGSKCKWVYTVKFQPSGRLRDIKQVPKHLWVEAFTTAVYLINRFLFSVMNMQYPFSSLYGHDTFQGEITTLSETSDWGGRHFLVGDHRRQEWHSRKALSCHTPFQ
ncbi:hypothetical protein FXO37_06112 [Capsicum annuum]|nr:hypothetical protein FXO37_06112 [Capsicum annuum]